MTASELRDVPAAFDARVEETERGRALIVSLEQPQDVISWALVNGGRRRANRVIWREVRLAELGPSVDAGALLRETLARLGAPDAVGLLTARDVRRFEQETALRGGVRARCIATVGLGNALAAGDPPGASPGAGTINLLCQVSVALSEEALVEACALAAEARTAALLQEAVPSVISGRPATGTGTDCIVVAAPVAAPVADSAPSGERFAGKHTAVGSAIGAAVFGAVARGVRRWIEENACRAK